MGYWDATDAIIRANGGRNPICPRCGKEMIPIDDHGRFSCGCPGSDFFSFLEGKYSTIPQIPQVPAGTELTDEQKEQIPAINRLHLPPTEWEKKILKELQELHGID